MLTFSVLSNSLLEITRNSYLWANVRFSNLLLLVSILFTFFMLNTWEHIGIRIKLQQRSVLAFSEFPFHSGWMCHFKWSGSTWCLSKYCLVFLLFKHWCGDSLPYLCFRFWNCVLVPGTFQAGRSQRLFLGGSFVLQLSEIQHFSGWFSLRRFILQSDL